MSTPDILSLLDQIERRAEAATLGPWWSAGKYHICAAICEWPQNEHGGRFSSNHVAQVTDRADSDYSANQIFIAAARSDVPALVKALRRAIKIIVTDMPEMAYQTIIEERETGKIEKLPNCLQAKADTFAQDIAAILSGEAKQNGVPEPGDVTP